MPNVTLDKIRERWVNRVIRNNWDKDPDGADQYMKKYGKGISEEKVEALMEYAKGRSTTFYVGMKKHLDHLVARREAKAAAERLG